MKRPSWCCTILTQLFMCVALYVVLHLGQPQEFNFRGATSDRRSDDVYFISVRGGLRPLGLQTLLLKQMDKAAKIYKARFVVNISELGKDDPLLQNGTLRFPFLKVPWYTTITSKGQGNVSFMDQFKLPLGKTIDIIGLNTGSIEETVRTGKDIGKYQLNWLTKTLQSTDSNWRIVVGFHSMVSCNKDNKQLGATEIYEPVHEIFVRYGVNAYLSLRNCTNYVRQDGISYLGNPSATEHEPFLASVTARSNSNRDMLDGFLLHRVSSLEIATYFVSMRGEVVDQNVIQQGGRETM